MDIVLNVVNNICFNIRKEKMTVKRITFASGNYINLYGNGDVFIILNEANSEPTYEEYCKIEQEITPIMQTDEILTKKILEKRIDKKLTLLEDQLKCLQFGYQLRIDKASPWSSKIGTYYEDLQELNISADEYNTVISHIYEKTPSEMFKIAKAIKGNDVLPTIYNAAIFIKAFERVLNLRCIELEQVKKIYNNPKLIRKER